MNKIYFFDQLFIIHEFFRIVKDSAPVSVPGFAAFFRTGFRAAFDFPVEMWYNVRGNSVGQYVLLG